MNKQTQTQKPAYKALLGMAKHFRTMKNIYWHSQGHSEFMFQMTVSKSFNFMHDFNFFFCFSKFMTKSTACFGIVGVASA